MPILTVTISRTRDSPMIKSEKVSALMEFTFSCSETVNKYVKKVTKPHFMIRITKKIQLTYGKENDWVHCMRYV